MTKNTPQLNLPDDKLKIDDERIFDAIRKKWVTLTPEEWVRQSFLSYLTTHKNFPKSLIKVEETIKSFNQIRRCDAVIYSRQIEPIAILECKAPGISISEKTFQQISIYNSAIKAPFLLLTNGLEHYCCHINLQNNSFNFWDHIPDYDIIEKHLISDKDLGLK